jgi:16S rRNA (cytosine1402-N4)-methyltransferase
MTNHRPVLERQVLRYLQPKPKESYLDVTAGYGGHAKAILAKTAAYQKAVLIDRDSDAISVLKGHFAKEGVRIIHQDFLSASKLLADEGQSFDMILADLGASSPHFENPERGFSFRISGPLDMRMDLRQSLTAADIVNFASEAELVRIFKEFGEEPKAKRIAREIVRQRPLRTTDQLAAIATRAWIPHFGHRKTRRFRRHPATRIFQALRIAVNDELTQLEQVLPIWLQLLNPGGRLVIISFHSLEDRIVKHFFADHSSEDSNQLKILTKKPIVASTEEIASNPRARSAKLRAAVKIKTNRKDQRKAPNAY